MAKRVWSCLDIYRYTFQGTMLLAKMPKDEPGSPEP